MILMRWYFSSLIQFQYCQSEKGLKEKKKNLSLHQHAVHMSVNIYSGTCETF